MPEHDVENRAAVFGWPSCSKPLESITFVILDQPHPTSSRSVRRAYNMGSTVRSKKMAVSEPSGRLPAAMAAARGTARVPVPQAMAGDLASQSGIGVARLQTHARDLATLCARGVDESCAQRGRGERRMPVAPAASCALGIGRTHTSNNEYTGITRHSRTQWF